jgi:hypothetical protein
MSPAGLICDSGPRPFTYLPVVRVLRRLSTFGAEKRHGHYLDDRDDPAIHDSRTVLPLADRFSRQFSKRGCPRITLRTDTSPVSAILISTMIGPEMPCAAAATGSVGRIIVMGSIFNRMEPALTGGPGAGMRDRSDVLPLQEPGTTTATNHELLRIGVHDGRMCRPNGLAMTCADWGARANCRRHVHRLLGRPSCQRRDHLRMPNDGKLAEVNGVSYSSPPAEPKPYSSTRSG